MVPSPSLRQAVEAAYAAFSDQRVGKTLNVCRCPVCFADDVEVEQALVRTPLREISADLLAVYTNSAHGWDSEMMYFLPRYLDLIAQGEVPSVLDLTYSLSRLSGVDWHVEWAAPQVEALDNYFDMLLLDQVENGWIRTTGSQGAVYYGHTGLQDVLYLASNAGGDIPRLLTLLENTTSSRSTLHLAAFAIVLGAPSIIDKLDTDLVVSDDSRIAFWLTRPEIAERVQTAFFSTDDPVEQLTLSHAEIIIRTALAQRA